MNATAPSTTRRLRLRGEEAPDAVWSALTRIRVRQVRSRPTAMEIELDASASSPHELIDVGAEISLDLGDGALAFVGDVTSVAIHEAADGRLLRARAFDRLARLRHRHTVREAPPGSVADLVRPVLSDAGLEVAVDGDLPRVEHRIQHADNDLAFVVDLLRQVGADVDVDGTTAWLRSWPGNGAETALQLGDDLVELTRSASSEGDAASVRSRSWDPEAARAVDVVVSEDSTGIELDLETPAPTAERWLHDDGPLDEATARVVARSVLDRARADALTVEGRLVGRPEVHAGSRCRFLGHGGETLGVHVLAVVDHELTGAGLSTTFTTRRPPTPATRPARGVDLARGVVVDVADPAGRGRIRLRLPTLGDATTPWLDVVLPGANASRGVLAVPAEGDVVAALFPDGDLARGLVIGGTLGPDGPPDDLVHDGRVSRHAWHSSPHQFVRLDDRTGAVVARNRAGSRLVLGSETLELHGETDVVIEAPGRTITIRAAAVEFEKVEDR